MNMLLTWIHGLIFLTCLYGQVNSYAANWFLIGGMLYAAVVITLLITEVL